MLEIALKIPEIIMPLLINALRCLMELQKADTETHQCDCKDKKNTEPE